VRSYPGDLSEEIELLPDDDDEPLDLADEVDPPAAADAQELLDPSGSGIPDGPDGDLFPTQPDDSLFEDAGTDLSTLIPDDGEEVP
jgi:hypothetical protein